MGVRVCVGGGARMLCHNHTVGDYLRNSTQGIKSITSTPASNKDVLLTAFMAWFDSLK